MSSKTAEMENAVKEKLRSTLEKMKQKARVDEDEQFAKVIDKKLKEINSLTSGPPVFSSADSFPNEPVSSGLVSDPYAEIAVRNCLGVSV